MSRKYRTVEVGAVLAELMAQAKFRRGPRLAAALEAVRRVLPEGASRGVEAYRLDGGVLRLFAPSPAQAQELRFAAPRILEELRAEGIEAQEVRVRLGDGLSVEKPAIRGKP